MEQQPILVKIKAGLEHLSSYNKEIEDFVSTKPHRIIKVIPFEDNGILYFKCPELDYWTFTSFMIENINPIAKEKANLYISYMISGGVCVYGKAKREVFQGNDGNFYIKKFLNKKREDLLVFKHLFSNLEVI